MSLSIRDRVRLSGGYDTEPNWLQGKGHYLGTVLDFIPGQNNGSAAVIELDDAITIAGVSGRILVLELRYVGTQWGKSNTVHVELCDFVPEPKPWQYRRQGKWVESHASCQVVLPTSGRPRADRQNERTRS